MACPRALSWKYCVQVLMVINTIFLASLSLLTLPLYSITVQMGGDFKANLLPEGVVNNAIRIQGLQVPFDFQLTSPLVSSLTIH